MAKSDHQADRDELARLEEWLNEQAHILDIRKSVSPAAANLEERANWRACIAEARAALTLAKRLLEERDVLRKTAERIVKASPVRNATFDSEIRSLEKQLRGTR